MQPHAVIFVESVEDLFFGLHSEAVHADDVFVADAVHGANAEGPSEESLCLAEGEEQV